jgi:hypothetical protein
MYQLRQAEEEYRPDAGRRPKGVVHCVQTSAETCGGSDEQDRETREG